MELYSQAFKMTSHERYVVSNQPQLGCLFNGLLVIILNEFQMASNEENFSKSRWHGTNLNYDKISSVH